MSQISKTENINTLFDLYKSLPEKKWSEVNLCENVNISLEELKNFDQRPSKFHVLSRFPNLTFSYVLENSSLDWEWYIISVREDIISLDDIEAHPELPWDYTDGVSFREDITIEFIKKYPDKLWNWNALCYDLPLRIIQENLDLPWNYESLSFNKTLTIEFIYQHLDQDWNFTDISLNINPNEFEKDVRKLLDWSCLHHNSRLTSKFILRHLDYSWRWDILSLQSLNFDLLIGIHEFWYWEGLSANPAISRNFVDYYQDKFIRGENWIRNLCQNDRIDFEVAENLRNFRALSMHPKLDIDFVLEHKNEFCRSDIEQLCRNGSFGSKEYQILLNHGFKLLFSCLSESENLSYEFIYKHKDKDWNWKSLSCNNFGYKRKANVAKKIVCLYKYRKLRFSLEKLNSYLITDLSKIIVKYTI